MANWANFDPCGSKPLNGFWWNLEYTSRLQVWPHKQIHMALGQRGWSRRTRGMSHVLVWRLSFFLYTCDRDVPLSVDQFRRLEMLFGSRLVWVQKTSFRQGWTSSPPNTYDGSICAAGMQTVATITLATCSSCRRAALNLENDTS